VVNFTSPVTVSADDIVGGLLVNGSTTDQTLNFSIMDSPPNSGFDVDENANLTLNGSIFTNQGTHLGRVQ
jgi:hypothetical protein